MKGLSPADYDYADVLMQREHLSRQQRIRLVQRTHRKESSRRMHTCRSPVGAVGKAQIVASTAETNTCRRKTQGRRHKTEYRVVEAVGKAKQVICTASSRGKTRGEVRLASDRRDEDRESNARQIEENNREDAAKQHYLKAMLLKVWRALVSVTDIAYLQAVKAERHHQYCVMHRIWIKLIHNVTCSRAHKTEQVSKQC